MNKMKYGMPTLLECENLADNASLCLELGLSFIELSMNLPQYQADELLKIKKYENLEYTIHLPEDFNVWDFNPLVRSAYAQTFAETVAAGKKLGVRLLNMHMSAGVYFTLPGKKVHLYEKYRDHFMQATEKFMQDASPLLRESGMSLCVENTGIYDRAYITDAVELLLQSPVIFLTWDIGHDHTSGNKDRSFIGDRPGKLRHLHLHDAKADKNHLELGSGELDIAGIIAMTETRVERIVIETKTKEALRASVGYLRQRGLL